MTVTETPLAAIGPGDTPDGFFRLVAGLYVAVLVAPAATIALWLYGTTDPGVLYGTLLGTTAVVTVVTAWLSGYIAGLPERLGRSAAVWGFVALPFGYFVPLAVGSASGPDSPSVVLALGLVAVVPGMFLGIGLVAMAHNRYTKAVLESATERARFRAAFPERERRLVRAAALVLILLGVAGFAADAALGFGAPYRWLFQLFTPLGAVTFVAAGPRKFAVTDAGLVVERPVHRYVRPWDAFAGYALTDDALVIRRRTRWLPDIYCARSDIKDAKTVGAALSGFLESDRHDGDGPGT